MKLSNLADKLRLQNGFTLVEVLASLTILTLVTLIFTGIIQQGALLSYSNRVENSAMQLAQDKMEEIKSTWPSKATDLDGIPRDTNDRVERNGVTFTRTWDPTSIETVTYAPYSAEQHLFKVVVTVDWDTKTKTGTVTKKSINMVTYLTGR